ncbi:hypothetical protein QQS21_003347 [Conoideocrella luteorostrata]|uniref:Xylanolytic transcriptional activator regulatory domain-containing protein n=1 Tax=Conoideocrella luteorostrata TaxID=1105319 RepID=A0AAJ0CTI6_9HYPO|nr:hypothetical protein QQS21_003347 [Conoideocrella luteorostrata]
MKSSLIPRAVSVSSLNPFGAINDRLEKLEDAIKSLAPHGLEKERENSPRGFGVVSQTEWMTSNCKPIHGQSSFDGQVEMASHISQLPTPGTVGDSAVLDEVRTLRAMIQDRTSAIASHPTSSCISSNLQPDEIPVAFALRVLHLLKETPRLLFLMHPIQNYQYVEDLLQRIYFPLKPVSNGHLTVFFGVMYYATREMLEVGNSSNIARKQLEQYSATSQKMFQAGIKTHELSAVPSFENALALALALLDAQLTGDLTLQWSLTSAAATHCITLGYHRESTLNQLAPDAAEPCRLLFWHIYISNMSLILPLGKAGVIHAYDIDVEPPALSTDPRVAVWDACRNILIRFLTLHGEIYEQLYSPASLRLDLPSRQQNVSVLVRKLESWHFDWKSIDYSEAHYASVFRIVFLPINVIYWSVLTLTYRASTTSSTIEELPESCFSAARKGLETHLSLYPEFQAGGPGAIKLYAIWILIHSSFAPYIMTFVHCIVYGSKDDLDLLGRVLETLDEIATVSGPCQRQISVCRALHRTAKASIESNGIASVQDHARSGKVMNLPLQNPSHEQLDWDYFQSHIDEWIADGVNVNSFNLGHRLD